MSKTLAVELTVEQLRKQAEEQRTHQPPLPPPGGTPHVVVSAAVLEQMNAQLASLSASLEHVQAVLAQRRQVPETVPVAAGSSSPRSARIVRALLWALAWAAAGAAYVGWRAFEERRQAEPAPIAVTAPVPPSTPAPRALAPLEAPIVPAAPAPAVMEAAEAFSIDIE